MRIVPVFSRGFILALVFLWAPGPAGEVAAQDVEILGEQYGTRPPDGYYQELARDPRAFRFEREGRERLLYIQERRGARFRDVILRYGPEARSIGPRDVPMVGAFRFPLVLGLFADSPEVPPYERARMQRELFDGPNSYHQTVPELYDEMSGGRVELQGTTFPWVTARLTQSQVTRSQSGLVSHPTEGVGNFIVQLLEELDSQGVDWSRFDHTGDGFVDVLAVVHPTHGAECGGGSSRVWSHRWTIRAATQGQYDPGFQTSTPRSDGSGFIYVNDYTIQPALACDGESINEIGVFAHELGHGFGLPDLYGTYGAIQKAAGRWDLMGTGAWGCKGVDPARPCHMGAWSKAVLGWVEVMDLQPDTDHGTLVLSPVQTSGRVMRIEVQDGSREYLLLENRQRVGSDQNLWEPGLLIWHVDPEVLDERWTNNSVNVDARRMGVWLRQADGRDELATVHFNHGDPGDPFPGCIKDDYWDYFDPSVPCLRTNTEFHAGKSPRARGHGGEAMGVTLTDIELVGGEPHDVRFQASTRFTRVTMALAAEGEGAPPPPSSPFRVDGQDISGEPAVMLSAPFDVHTLEAPPGALLSEGVRVGFQGWSDGAPRVRELVTPARDTTLTVQYGGEEVRLTWTAAAPGPPIAPGTLHTEPSSPDLWFPRGTEATLEARARSGFSFVGWLGELAGSGNPTTVHLDEPLSVGGEFSFDYGFTDAPDEVIVEAAVPFELGFEVENAQDPVQWSMVAGELPEGLGFSSMFHRISGTPMELGEFTVRIRARDATGLDAVADVTFRVTRPRLGMDRLTSPFTGGEADEPSTRQREFLDLHGNQDGRYDVGDLRRFLRAFPEVMDEDAVAAVHPAPPARILVRFSDPDHEEERR